MATEEQIIRELSSGMQTEYGRHSWERKRDVILISVLIDIRDELKNHNDIIHAIRKHIYQVD